MTDSQTKQQKIDLLNERIMSCEVCKELCESCSNPVPGEGNIDAEIMFIGEAPGKMEDEQGRPFVGASGKFLEEMLGLINLKREEVFITNIVKYRPADNRDPLPTEIKQCLPFLLEQIKIIKPKLIVFLGRHSANTFFPKLKISLNHGKAIRSNNQVFLPLYHPAAALYNGSIRETLIKDFKKIPKILKLITNSA